MGEDKSTRALRAKGKQTLRQLGREDLELDEHESASSAPLPCYPQLNTKPNYSPISIRNNPSFVPLHYILLNRGVGPYNLQSPRNNNLPTRIPRSILPLKYTWRESEGSVAIRSAGMWEDYDR